MALARAEIVRSASTFEEEEWVPEWPSASVTPTDTDEVPSGRLFEILARTSPVRLLQKMLSGDLSNAHLALAAEVAGREAPTYLVEQVLLLLLDQHSSATVREGCVLGLTPLLGTRPEVEDAVRRHANSRYESSSAVRETAEESLSLLGD